MHAPAGIHAAPLRLISLVAAVMAAASAFVSFVPARASVDAAPAQSLPVAISADLTSKGDHTRLTFAMSKPVTATSFLLERPDRIIVDLDAVNFQLPADAGSRPSGLVRSFRCGLAAPGRSRIVIDLAAPARLAHLEVERGAVAGVSLLSLDLVRTDRDGFRRALAQTDESTDGGDIATTASLAAPEEADRRPVVVIDAGHGGVDPGATSTTGVFEKDIVLAFARSLHDRLAAAGLYRIVMTRDHDVFIPLDERVHIARAAGAALFISIHADSISTPAISGTTIYTGAERATDVESATLAERENAADSTAGGGAADRPDDVIDILEELTSRETRSFSQLFAGYLLKDLRRVTHFTARPRREAGFRVLRSGDIPAVLVELGYLSNTGDVGLMVSADWRERTTAAMADAVGRFFEIRTAAGAPVSP